MQTGDEEGVAGQHSSERIMAENGCSFVSEQGETEKKGGKGVWLASERASE